MNIVLCGMMGAGKTSVGKKLEEMTGRPCVDTDDMIVEKHGRITDIFEKYGEPYFRDLETGVAEEISKSDNLIVSTGGGMVMRPLNAEFLKRNGKIVFLRARLETLLKRVEGDDSRPLLKGGAEERLRELIAVRTPVYEAAADFVVDTDGMSLEDVAREILSLTGQT